MSHIAQRFGLFVGPFFQHETAICRHLLHSICSLKWNAHPFYLFFFFWDWNSCDSSKDSNQRAMTMAPSKILAIHTHRIKEGNNGQEKTLTFSLPKGFYSCERTDLMNWYHGLKQKRFHGTQDNQLLFPRFAVLTVG